MNPDLRKYSLINENIQVRTKLSPFVKKELLSLVARCRNAWASGQADPTLEQDLTRFFATHGNEVIAKLD